MKIYKNIGNLKIFSSKKMQKQNKRDFIFSKLLYLLKIFKTKKIFKKRFWFKLKDR